MGKQRVSFKNTRVSPTHPVRTVLFERTLGTTTMITIRLELGRKKKVLVQQLLSSGCDGQRNRQEAVT